MSTATSTQVHLVSRPVGWPTAENFRLVEVPLGALEPGQVRVRNEFVSVDPYMRGRMNAAKTYAANYELNTVMFGGAVGRVEASNTATLPVGTLVLHSFGWRDRVQADATKFRALPELDGVSSSLWLGMLGMPGLTAYTALKKIAQLREGETVFISGAAGAVGTAAGQIARQLGAAHVIGSAGSPEKVKLLTERYGYDSAFNYKDAPVSKQLRAAAPDGIDVLIDNVGGDHLEAALGVMNDFGRGALVGAISQYNNTEAVDGPRNMGLMVTKRLMLRGFIVFEHPELGPEFEQRMTEWITAGQVAHDETVVDGIEHAVDAFLGMMRGENIGKMVVRI